MNSSSSLFKIPADVKFYRIGYRYYLNIDRCAYGQLRDTKDRATGQKEVHGPKIFAVDRKCWHAYFYTDVNIKEEWKPYSGVYGPNTGIYFVIQNHETGERRTNRINRWSIVSLKNFNQEVLDEQFEKL